MLEKKINFFIFRVLTFSLVHPEKKSKFFMRLLLKSRKKAPRLSEKTKFSKQKQFLIITEKQRIFYRSSRLECVAKKVFLKSSQRTFDVLTFLKFKNFYNI